MNAWIERRFVNQSCFYSILVAVAAFAVAPIVLSRNKQYEDTVFVVCGGAYCVAVFEMCRATIIKRRRPMAKAKAPVPTPPPKDVLDDELFRWTKKDPVTVRDLMNGICVFGRVGSGKTSGSGEHLARAILSQGRSR